MPATPPAADVLRGLNDQQRAAASHGDGPLLIVAGAGTGKTTTLAARVAHLIAAGADPAGILLLTFTRRAAAEMRGRVAARLRGVLGEAGEHAAKRVWGGTFHAVAARLLRTWHAALNLPPDFTILDRGDTEDLLDLCRGRLGLPNSGVRFPKKAACAAVLSRSLNAGEPLGDVLASRFPHLAPHEPACGGCSTCTRSASRPRTCSITTTCSCSGKPSPPTPSPAPPCVGGSPACWWTSTRTPTSCRPVC